MINVDFGAILTNQIYLHEFHTKKIIKKKNLMGNLDILPRAVLKMAFGGLEAASVDGVKALKGNYHCVLV